MKLAVISTLFATALFGQTITPVTPTFSNLPNYWAAVGGGYTQGGYSEGIISFGANIAGSYYSKTTFDVFKTYTSVRTGFCKAMAQSGNWTLLACVDAGISTGTPVIGNFTGGATAAYNLGNKYKSLAGTFVAVEFRVTGATTSTTVAPNQVTPGVFLAVGKSF
jgi:hypothetical protein